MRTFADTGAIELVATEKFEEGDSDTTPQLRRLLDTGAGAELFLELAGKAADGALLAQPKSLVWDQVHADDPSAKQLEEFGRAYTSEYGTMSASPASRGTRSAC